MLPPLPMLAIKKLLPHFFLQCAAPAALLLLAGCIPPGPRALLQGDRLLQTGQFQQALEKLKTATALLPQDPRAWNYLGLAYQGTGDGPHAIEAFRYALSLDHSNLAIVAHYNLGCALLEQGNPVAAANELRSFYLLSNSLPALSKLATADLRSRQFDAAEKDFISLLKQRPGDAAAQNGLGLVFAQRNRPREAAQWFQSALKSDPKYAPALLNLAVIYHHQPAQKAYAAQKYREYLALDPHSANSETVKSALARLDVELAPRPAPTNAAPVLPPKTNAPVPVTNPPPAVPPAPSHHSLTQAMAAVAATTTNVPKPAAPVVVVTNIPKPPPASAAATNVVRPVTNVPRVVVAPPPVVRPVPVMVSNPPLPIPPPPPIPVVVVALSNETPLKPALDVPAKPTPPAPPPVVVATVSPPMAATSAPPVHVASNLWVVRAPPPAQPEKTSFLESLNPFRKKPRPMAPATNTIVIPTIRPAPFASNPVVAVAAVVPAPPRPVVPRYTYLAPAKPARGDHKAAEVLFHQAFKAQQDGKPDEALPAYRAALEKDPAYFEADYNAGLLAFQAADWATALRWFETALAIMPEAVNARLNLGLALDRANYPQDAANELEKVVSAQAEDARAHLTLGNLYAQKLGQPVKAREHYQKVLELEPQHPQASAIRYWVAAHP